jgi:hypothetical protein
VVIESSWFYGETIFIDGQAPIVVQSVGGTTGTAVTLSASMTTVANSGGPLVLSTRSGPIRLASLTSDVPLFRIAKVSNSAPGFPAGLVGQPILFRVNGVEVGTALLDQFGNANLSYNIDLPAGTYTVEALFRGHAKYGPASGKGTLTVDARTATLQYTGDLSQGAGEFTLQATLTDNGSAPFDLSKAGAVLFEARDSGGAVLDTFRANVGPDGVASLKVPALPVGVAALTVRLAESGYFRAEPATVQITAAAAPASISVAAVSGQYSDPVELTADTGLTGAGQAIKFMIDGRDAGSATADASGKAVLRYLVADRPGAHELKVSFLPQGQQAAVEGVGTLTVVPEAATLQYTGDTRVAPTGTTLSAKVVQEDDGAPGDLSQAQVRFVLKDATGIVGTIVATVDASGVATAAVKEMPSALLEIDVELVSAFFTAPAATGTLSAPEKGRTQLTVADATVGQGKTLEATVTLTANGAPLSGQAVTWKVGEARYTLTTDSQGTAVFTHAVAEEPGTYRMTAEFAGSALYEAASASSTLTVTAPAPSVPTPATPPTPETPATPPTPETPPTPATPTTPETPATPPTPETPATLPAPATPAAPTPETPAPAPTGSVLHAIQWC